MLAREGVGVPEGAGGARGQRPPGRVPEGPIWHRERRREIGTERLLLSADIQWFMATASKDLTTLHIYSKMHIIINGFLEE